MTHIKLILAGVCLLGSLSMSAQPNLVLQPGSTAIPLGFHPTKPLWFFNNYSKIHVLDWERIQLVDIELTGIVQCSSSPDGQHTAFAGGDQVVLLHHGDGTLKEYEGPREVNFLCFSPDSRFLAIESDSQVVLLSLKTGSTTGVFNKSRSSEYSCGFGQDELWVVGRKEIYSLRLPDLQFKTKRTFQGDFRGTSNGGRYFFFEHKDSLLVFTNDFDRPLGKIKISHSIGHLTKTTNAVSSDGKRMILHLIHRGKRIAFIYDMISGRELRSIELPEASMDFISLPVFAVDPSWKYAAYVNKSNGTNIIDVESGQEVCRFYSIGLEDFILIIPGGYYMATRQGAYDGVSFEINGEHFSYDQFDAVYNRPDLVLKHLGLTNARDVDLFERAYQKRLRSGGIPPAPATQNLLEAPTVSFEQELPVFTEGTNLLLAVKAESNARSLRQINLYVNGIPLFGKKGYTPKSMNDKTFRQTFEVTLTPGDNRVELEAVNIDGVRSARALHIVHCEAPSTPPDLYLVAIGVSAYRDSSRNLSYARTDAAQVIELFQNNHGWYKRLIPFPLLDSDFTPAMLQQVKQSLQQSKPLDHVIVFFAGHGLVDANLDYYLGTSTVDFVRPATSGMPYAELENLFDGIPARNRLLLVDACFSGEIDKETSRRIQLENTITGNVQFRAGMEGLEPGKTAEERIFHLMRTWFAELSSSNGATVISGTSGMQMALEGEQWKNGVFTWCLLNGLSEKKADSNNDGEIYLSELRHYLEGEVPRQTRGRQQPTLRMENMESNFRVW